MSQYDTGSATFHRFTNLLTLGQIHAQTSWKLQVYSKKMAITLTKLEKNMQNARCTALHDDQHPCKFVDSSSSKLTCSYNTPFWNGFYLVESNYPINLN
jgi:hypothetical protein